MKARAARFDGLERLLRTLWVRRCIGGKRQRNLRHGDPQKPEDAKFPTLLEPFSMRSSLSVSRRVSFHGRWNKWFIYYEEPHLLFQCPFRRFGPI